MGHVNLDANTLTKLSESCGTIKNDWMPKVYSLSEYKNVLCTYLYIYIAVGQKLMVILFKNHDLNDMLRPQCMSSH